MSCVDSACGCITLLGVKNNREEVKRQKNIYLIRELVNLALRLKLRVKGYIAFLP
jgi:hypothetical protein